MLCRLLAFILSVFCLSLFLSHCGGDGPNPNVIRDTLNLGGFCGRSTEADCSSDRKCIASGCNGELCQHYTQMISTICMWQCCYRDEDYGVKCGCVEGKCQWYKEVPKND